MIRAINAITMEIDDIPAAVSEILDQLDLPGNQLAHTVGMITCHYEFVQSGVVAALCEALPFDVVGSSTTGQAVNGDREVLSLALLMLTSNDVSFSAACSASISQALEAPVRAAYREAAESLGTAPRMMLTFAPLLLQYAGDQYVDILDDVSGGVPNFGTLSMDDTKAYDCCYTIYNGQCTQDTLALLLLAGDVQPVFKAITVSGQNVLSQETMITKSAGNLVQEINGTPFVTFLEGLGLSNEDKVADGLNYLICMLDTHDGAPPTSKVLIGINEQGDGICGGYMPEGAALHISTLEREDVLRATGETIGEMLTLAQDKSVLLAFSCHTRNVVLGSDVYAEFDAARNLVGDALPFLMSCSGGEICPYVDEAGRIINRFHNNALVVCMF